MGGGSGGHVTPVAAVIEQLKTHDDSLAIRFVCDRAFEAQSRGIMAQSSVPIVVSTITAGKFRRYAHLSFLQHLKHPSIVIRNIVDIVKVAIGFLQSLWLLVWFRPDVVFAKGGYVCLPMGIAAWCLRIPLVIHDSDSRPGLTSKILARFADTIATGFPLENYPYPKERSVYTGVPIDEQFHSVSQTEQASAKAALGFTPETPVIVAFGGGLGSVRINDAMPNLARSLDAQVQVYNVTGKNNLHRAKEQGGGVENYHPVGFVYGMYSTLAAADLVITRASATALQELAGLKKAVIAVPAQQLSDQIKNAAVFGEADAVVVATDDELSTDDFRESVQALLDESAARQRLAENIHAFARPEAARVLAALVVKASRR